MNHDINTLDSSLEAVIPTVSTYFTGNKRTSKYKDEFIKSIDIFKKWHEELENLFFEDKPIATREETVALIRTSAVDSDDLYFMGNMVLCTKVRDYLPIMIFNYLTNFTHAKLKRAKRIKEGRYKRKVDKLTDDAMTDIDKEENKARKKKEVNDFIGNLLFQSKIPRYLKETECEKDSMTRMFDDELMRKVKCRFIHIVSFLKIMSLPICEESDKLFCFYWYYNHFISIADMFFSDDEQYGLNVFEFVKNKCSKFGKLTFTLDLDDVYAIKESQKDDYNQIYNKMISYLDLAVKSIARIEKMNDIFDNANIITAFIEGNKEKNDGAEESKSFEGKTDFEEDINPVKEKEFRKLSSFSNRFDYFCGKNLYKLMIDKNREFDLVNLFEFTPKSVEAAVIRKEGNQGDNSKLLSIKDIDFVFDDIKCMWLDENMVLNNKPYYYPLYTLVFQKEQSYYMEGSISIQKGSIMIGETRINCNISRLKTENEQAIYFDSLKFIFKRCPKLKNSKWALYVLSYFIIYKGYREKFPTYYKKDELEES